MSCTLTMSLNNHSYTVWLYWSVDSREVSFSKIKCDHTWQYPRLDFQKVLHGTFSVTELANSPLVTADILLVTSHYAAAVQLHMQGTRECIFYCRFQGLVPLIWPYVCNYGDQIFPPCSIIPRLQPCLPAKKEKVAYYENYLSHN